MKSICKFFLIALSFPFCVGVHADDRSCKESFRKVESQSESLFEQAYWKRSEELPKAHGNLLSRLERESYLRRPKFQTEPVEVGVFLVTFKDGQTMASPFFSSKESSLILGKDVDQALFKGVLDRLTLQQRRNVESLTLYHTHPTKNPVGLALSTRDIEATFEYQMDLQLNYQIKPRVTVVAMGFSGILRGPQGFFALLHCFDVD